MRIFKIARFARFAEKESITDADLLCAANQLEQGQFDADLGGGVYKKRLARPGAGKSGGYRLIVCLSKGASSFFIHGFAKSDKDNITPAELRDLKKAAQILFAMSDAQLTGEVAAGRFLEITEEKS